MGGFHKSLGTCGRPEQLLDERLGTVTGEVLKLNTHGAWDDPVALDADAGIAVAQGRVEDHGCCHGVGVDGVDQDVLWATDSAQQPLGGGLCPVFIGRSNERYYRSTG
jgi:hypothetical protein